MNRFALGVVVGLLLFSTQSLAQNVFNTPSGPTTVGVVIMCMNGSNQAVPCSGSVSLVTSDLAIGSLGQAISCLPVSNSSMLQCLEAIHADLNSALVPSTAAQNWLGNVGLGIIVNPNLGAGFSSFTVAQNTHTYSSGQLIANSTTAGSVVPLSWTAARVVGGNFTIARVRFTSNAKPATNRAFRIHFILPTTGGAAPTVANGDGGTFTATLVNEVCAMDIVDTTFTVGSDVSVGYGVPISGSGNGCNIVAQGGLTTLYAFVEARAAYVSGTSEVITVVPEILQNYLLKRDLDPANDNTPMWLNEVA